MPVFTLKKYEEAPAASDPKSAQSAATEPTENLKEETVTIHANASVSQIVANALYKSLSNVSEEEGGSAADTQVISTEDINASPVDTWNLVKNTRTVVIVNQGFSTAKEEWFLDNLETSGAKVFYSIESYLRTLGACDQVSH